MKNLLTINIGGDFAPINGAEKTAIELPEQIWGDAIELFKNADLSIVNLEVPLTGSIEKIDKTGPNIKAPKECVSSLKAAGIDLVTLANNHIYDFGDKGVADTLEVCKENGIDTVGAGMNLEEAQKTYYKEIKGLKIAVVNFAENEWNSAEVDHAGSNPMDLIDNIKQIRNAKKNSDFVMVIVHGGHEYYLYPSPRMQKEYRFYAEEGANIVVGHHTHCVSGYEIHNDVPIFYSLGNLFFPWKGKPDFWYEGMLLKLNISIENKKIDFELIPYEQCKEELKIKILEENDKKDFDRKIEQINEVISKRNMLNKKWIEFVEEKKKEYLKYALIPFNFVRGVFNKLNLTSFFYSEKQKLLLHNIVRCESHREMMLNSLVKDGKVDHFFEKKDEGSFKKGDRKVETCQKHPK